MKWLKKKIFNWLIKYEEFDRLLEIKIKVLAVTHFEETFIQNFVRRCGYSLNSRFRETLSDLDFEMILNKIVQRNINNDIKREFENFKRNTDFSNTFYHLIDCEAENRIQKIISDLKINQEIFIDQIIERIKKKQL